MVLVGQFYPRHNRWVHSGSIPSTRVTASYTSIETAAVRSSMLVMVDRLCLTAAGTMLSLRCSDFLMSDDHSNRLTGRNKLKRVLYRHCERARRGRGPACRMTATASAGQSLPLINLSPTSGQRASTLIDAALARNGLGCTKYLKTHGLQSGFGAQ